MKSGSGQPRVRDDVLAGAQRAMAEPSELHRALRAALRALEASEDRFRSAFHNGPLGMVMTALDGTILEANPAFCDLLGVGPDELAGQLLAAWVPDEDLPTAREALRRIETEGSSRFEVRYRHRDGHDVWGQVAVTTAGDVSGQQRYVVQVHDITDRKRAQEQLEFQVLHDPLTGLPNRVLINDRLRQALVWTGRSRRQVAVLFIDLDGFKHVNDTYGHAAGDQLLVQVAARLVAAVRETDTVGRLSGDEFLLVCEDLKEPHRATDIAERVITTLATPFDLGGRQVAISASVGIAHAGHSGEDPESLVRAADTAMYRAKQRGKNRYDIFDDGLREQTSRRQRAEETLRGALHASDRTPAGTRLAVHYQPIVDLATGQPVGVEALARLRTADGSLIPPSDFIPVAEDTGLICDLGAVVLLRAAEQAAAWQRALGMPVEIAVNVSAKQAARPDLIDTVRDVLGRTGLPAGCLNLELTETALLDAAPATLRQLRDLRELGVGIGIDDFGTGYASLRYLSELPVSFVKIDRSFVATMDQDPTAAVIIDAIVHLASSLHLLCIAEGVETQAQRDALAAYPGLLAQGFLFGRPGADRPKSVLPGVAGVPAAPAVAAAS